MALKGHCTFYAKPWLIGKYDSWQRISISCYIYLASSIPVGVVLGSFLGLGGRLLVGYICV